MPWPVCCLAVRLTAEEVELEVFTGPRGKESVHPVYPQIAQQNLREGWVQTHFMVGPDGRPYEIAVTDSMGSTAFHGSAVRALKKSLFEPARLNDAPIDAGFSRKFYFQIQGNTGARAPIPDHAPGHPQGHRSGRPRASPPTH